jgi:uncharacterized membrane protein
MIGGQEIIVILLIFLIIIFAALPLILRKYYPYKLWVGMILCLFLGTGQLYLPSGLKYLIGIGILYVLLKTLLADALLAMLIANLLSVGIIYWRFKRLEQNPFKKELDK